MVTAESEYGPALLEAAAITKRFGGAVAVDNVSISVRSGEIYGLVGENGAGKSTLMRVLAGILTPDLGEVHVDGVPLQRGPRAAIDAGISLVHQELSLVPEMTVAENILLGGFPTKYGFTEYSTLRQIAADALEEIGVSVDLDERVGRLSMALRQFVEIARAVAKKPRILIFDEPTATLTPAETDYLLAMLRRLAEGGMAIIYISHRIPEIFSTCSTVAILRDGKLVLTSAITNLTPSLVVDQMVGREFGLDLATHRTSTPGAIVLDAQGVIAPRVNDVSIQVRAGEIVGLGGLVGAGRSELVRAIIGADPRTSGNVTLTRDGKVATLGSYQSSVRNRVAYVPEERRKDGLALSMTVEDNIRLPNRRELSVAGFKLGRKVTQVAQSLVEKVGLRPPEIRREVGEYSGGNQQKVVLAKWLGRRPDFIVLDEPTRGVDVGAKVAITDIDLSRAQRRVEILASQGIESIAVQHDVTDGKSGERLVQQVLAAYGRVDLLVNNAGISGRVPLEEMSDQVWDSMIGVNLTGVQRTSRAVVPVMKEQRSGNIVSISSVAGRSGKANMTHYCSTKFGVIGFSQSLALELAPFDVRVNSVCPGIVRTQMWEVELGEISEAKGISMEEAWELVLSGIPLHRSQLPEDIGAAVAFLASPLAKNITGQALNVDGGFELS